MTSLAFKQYCNIPFSGGSYSSSPILGPISHQAPGQIPYHSYGMLPGTRPTPPMFGFGDGASLQRHQYARTAWSDEATKTGTTMKSPLKPTSVFNAGTQRSYLLSQSTKYIAPTDSSSFIATRKARAVGKSGMKIGLPVDALLTYKNYNRNDVKTALKSVRGGGSVAPAKKGSIFNHYLSNNNQGAGWGGIVTQNY